MVCVDSTFIIDVIRGIPEVKSLEEKMFMNGESVVIAAPSVIEIIRGFHLKSTQHRISDKEIKLVESLFSRMEVLPLDDLCARKAGFVHAELINQGLDIGISDVMIGTIAMVNNQSLLSRNVKHFSRIPGLRVEGY